MRSSVASSHPGFWKSARFRSVSNQPGEMTFAIGHRLFSGGLVITDAQAKEAMRVAFRYLRIVAEPGGAAALAAALACLPEDIKGKAVGVVVSGGNVDAAEYAKILTGS